MFLWLLGYHENFRFSLTLWLFNVLRRDCPKISGLQVSLIFKPRAPIYFQVSKGSLVYRFVKIGLPPPLLHQNVTLKNETLSCAIILSYHFMAPYSVCWYSICSIHILCCASMLTPPACHVEKPWPHTLRSLYLWYW